MPFAKSVGNDVTEKTKGGAFVRLIIITEICKTPALRLKAVNKHNVTHMYIEMDNV